MSTTPPEQPASPPPEEPGAPEPAATAVPPGGYYTGLGQTTGAILPVPGNAELVVYLFATLFLVIIWAASDALDAHGFSTLFTWLTFGYIVSRGIAKASRVLER
jgi:hypothetical protein